MRCSLRGLLLSGLFLTAWLVTAGIVRAGADDNKCSIATKGDSPVAKACADGGFKKAKQVMKELTKKAKAAGLKTECDDCHRDDETYDLADDARENFKKMLAAIERKH